MVDSVSENDYEPIVKIDEDEKPIFMITRDFEIGHGFAVNILATISYNQKEVKHKGVMRTRYADGDKSVWRITPKEGAGNPEDLKSGFRDIINAMDRFPGFTKWLNEPKELSFEYDVDMDELIKKLDESNLFDVGVVEGN